MSGKIEIELEKLERQQRAFQQEIAHWQVYLQLLRTAYIKIVCQQERQEQQPTGPLQEAQADLLARSLEALDTLQVLQALLARTRQSLAWWKQQTAHPKERA